MSEILKNMFFFFFTNKCTYIFTPLACFCFFVAPPRQCIDLFFEKYSIEPSWECKFDHIEVRDGPFGFSPIIGRYCGQQNPLYIRSSGRYLWIKFVADGELEAKGFSASYNFTAGNTYIFILTYQSLPLIAVFKLQSLLCRLVIYCCFDGVYGQSLSLPNPLIYTSYITACLAVLAR